jgi:RNA polymerase sigma-70 factor (ECF subfamily)
MVYFHAGICLRERAKIPANWQLSSGTLDMSQSDSEFQKAVERVCSGSEDAIWDFIETYGPHIQRVVRRRLHQGLRAKFDSIDFVQMVWASFFADIRKIEEMRDPEELILYLVNIARNKVIEETRRRLTYERYNVARERPLTSSDLTDPQSIRRNDTPSQHLIAKERLQQVMGTCGSMRDRRILEMRLKGATYVQIARTLGIHERTVRQIVDDVEHASARS